MLGMKTGRGAKEFVAKHGASALPYLDEAWARDSFGRVDVVVTWGYMLGPYGRRLSPDDSLALMARLLRAARAEPLAFAWAADVAVVLEAVPLLDSITATNGSQIVRRRAANVSAKLRRGRDALEPVQLLDRLNHWLPVLCGNAAGPKRTACDSLTGLSNTARSHLRAKRTRDGKDAIDTLIRAAEAASTQGSLDETEGALLIGTAQYVSGRL